MARGRARGVDAARALARNDSYGFFANVSFKNGFNEKGIFIISYTTTVVDDCTKVVEYFIWYYFVLFYE